MLVFGFVLPTSNMCTLQDWKIFSKIFFHVNAANEENLLKIKSKVITYPTFFSNLHKLQSIMWMLQVLNKKKKLSGSLIYWSFLTLPLMLYYSTCLTRPKSFLAFINFWWFDSNFYQLTNLEWVWTHTHCLTIRGQWRWTTIKWIFLHGEYSGLMKPNQKLQFFYWTPCFQEKMIDLIALKHRFGLYK